LGRQLPKDLPKEFENVEDVKEQENKERFPKKIGIVFIEETKKNKSKIKLNFDQIACAHLMLQMNSVQEIFDFQIVVHDENMLFFETPTKTNNIDLFKWFDEEISKFENSHHGSLYGMDYWIGITSENLELNRFVRPKESYEGISGKIIWMITSDIWEKRTSPPSLFEYVTITVLMCSLSSLSREFNGTLFFHLPYITKGCIFDFTREKHHRRILVSNPNLCSLCKKRLLSLETKINGQTRTKLHLCEDIEKVLSKKWMGSLDKIDSPIYNLKRNYGYDIDRNSGFYKRPLEKFRDSIIEKSAEWTIGGIIATALSVIGAYFIFIFGLKGT
jgi:hypothetical protein